MLQDRVNVFSPSPDCLGQSGLTLDPQKESR